MSCGCRRLTNWPTRTHFASLRYRLPVCGKSDWARWNINEDKKSFMISLRSDVYGDYRWWQQQRRGIHQRKSLHQFQLMVPIISVRAFDIGSKHERFKNRSNPSTSDSNLLSLTLPRQLVANIRASARKTSQPSSQLSDYILQWWSTCSSFATWLPLNHSTEWTSLPQAIRSKKGNFHSVQIHHLHPS